MRERRDSNSRPQHCMKVKPGTNQRERETPLPLNRILPAYAISPRRVQLSRWWNRALFKNAAAAITGVFPWAQIFLWQYACIELTGNRTALLSSLSETCESLHLELWATEAALLPQDFQSAFPPPGLAIPFPFCPHVGKVHLPSPLLLSPPLLFLPVSSLLSSSPLPFPKPLGLSPLSHIPRSIPVPLHSIIPCPFSLWLIKEIWMTALATYWKPFITVTVSFIFFFFFNWPNGKEKNPKHSFAHWELRKSKPQESLKHQEMRYKLNKLPQTLSWHSSRKSDAHKGGKLRDDSISIFFALYNHCWK